MINERDVNILRIVENDNQQLAKWSLMRILTDNCESTTDDVLLLLGDFFQVERLAMPRIPEPAQLA